MEEDDGKGANGELCRMECAGMPTRGSNYTELIETL